MTPTLTEAAKLARDLYREADTLCKIGPYTPALHSRRELAWAQFSDALDAALAATEASIQAVGWISVADRLPDVSGIDDGEAVLVANRGGSFCAEWHGTGITGFSSHGYDDQFTQVTHWQPLPRAPFTQDSAGSKQTVQAAAEGAPEPKGIRDALATLVSLKALKDSGANDEQYRRLQPFAWIEARRVLAAYPASAPQPQPASPEQDDKAYRDFMKFDDHEMPSPEPGTVKWCKKCGEGVVPGLCRRKDLPEQAQAKQDVQAVPEGFALVPKELDGDRLHDAWRAAAGKLDHAALRHVHATMIASPAPGAAPPVQGEPLDEHLRRSAEFGTWVKKAYRDAYEPGRTFSVYNMEVAFAAGRRHADELAALRTDQLRACATAALAAQADARREDGAMRKDAERYRWLLANYAFGDGFDRIDQALNDGEADEQLSAAIDAASLATPGSHT